MAGAAWAVGMLAMGALWLGLPDQTPHPSPDALIDGLGRAVAISAPPRRIVSIFASNTELLCALGCAPDIVAIEAMTRHPPEILDRPRIGGRLGFSAEAIAALDPDLVVMTTARGAAANLLAPLATIGVPAVVLHHHDVEQVFANLHLLGAATGRPDEADAVIAGLRSRLAGVAERLRDRPPVRVYLETASAGNGTFSSVVVGTYTHDALRLAGGTSVFPQLTRGLPVSGEAVIASDPEVILVCGTDADAARIAARPGWSGLRAVRAGRVHAVPRALLLIPGPRIVEGVELLADLLHRP